MRPVHVLIDPGHSGQHDPGAQANGLVESQLVWDLAAGVFRVLNATGWPIATKLTRYGDELPKKLELSERGKIGKDWGADLVLSIHANSNASPKVGGLMAFHWPTSKVGKAIADVIDAASPPQLRHPSEALEATRASWPRVRNVIKPHAAPAVLVEVGFLTNPQDAEALKGEGVRRELVAAMVAGVARGLTLLSSNAA